MYRRLKKCILASAFVIIILVLINKYLIINIHISSSSMESTLKVDDRLIVNRMISSERDIKRYQIIVFEDPFNKKELMIKRVIGLPGERVLIRKGKIFINDFVDPIEENYLSELWDKNNDGYEFQVPESSFFVLDDNRNDSFDSRLWYEYTKSKGDNSDR